MINIHCMALRLALCSSQAARNVETMEKYIIYHARFRKIKFVIYHTSHTQPTQTRNNPIIILSAIA